MVFIWSEHLLDLLNTELITSRYVCMFAVVWQAGLDLGKHQQWQRQSCYVPFTQFKQLKVFPVCADLTLELFCVACIIYTNTSLSKYYSVVARQFEACTQKLSIILFKNNFQFLEKYKYGTFCRFVFLYGKQSEHETESHFLTRNARITSVWKSNWLVSVMDQLLYVN